MKGYYLNILRRKKMWRETVFAFVAGKRLSDENSDLPLYIPQKTEKPRLKTGATFYGVFIVLSSPKPSPGDQLKKYL